MIKLQYCVPSASRHATAGMTERFVKPPFTRLVIAGVVFHVVALILFILCAAGTLSPGGGFAAVTGVTAAGVVLHLILLLINIIVRAESAHHTAETRHAFAADQWYAVVGLAGCVIVLGTVIGLWLAGGTELLAGILGLALVTAPALTTLTYVTPMVRDAHDTLESGTRVVGDGTHGTVQYAHTLTQRNGPMSSAFSMLAAQNYE